MRRIDQRLMLPAAVVLAAAAFSCKTTRPASAVRATTTLGPGETIDLTTYSVNGEDCTEAEFGGDRTERNLRRSQIDLSEENIPAAYKAIPRKELAAILDYTGNGYGTVNRSLRAEDLLELDALKGKIRCISSGLNKIPAYKGKVSRWARLTQEDIAAYKPGAIVIMRSFLSTGEGDVDTNLGLAGFCSNTKYLITSDKGRSIDEISSSRGELEVLFAPGSEFRVRSVREEAQPFAADDENFGDCVRRTPRRTVVTMEQVPSGTYKRENPQTSESLDVGVIQTSDDLNAILKSNSTAAHTQAGGLARLHLDQRIAAAASEADVLAAIGDVEASCATYGAAAPSAAWETAFYMPQCKIKGFKAGASTSFYGIPLAPNSAVTLAPNRGITYAVVNGVAAVGGWQISGDVKTHAPGKLAVFAYHGGAALTVGGAPLSPDPGAEVLMNEQGLVTSITFASRDEQHKIKGYTVKDKITFHPNGGIAEMTIDGNFANPSASVTGPSSTISFYPSGKLKRLRAEGLKLKRTDLSLDGQGRLTALFAEDGSLRRLDEVRSAFTYQGKRYKSLVFRTDGTIGAVKYEDEPTDLRLPCNTDKVFEVLMLSRKGKVVACSKYTSEINWQGKVYPEDSHFGLSEEDKVLDLAEPAAWNAYKASFGLGD